jgi:hypothetical protein
MAEKAGNSIGVSRREPASDNVGDGISFYFSCFFLIVLQ